MTRPRILVLGLHAQQMEQVRREFDERLDLRFITSDSSLKQLRRSCEAYDKVVAMTGFLSHKHTDVLRRKEKEVIKVIGGVTRLREVLEQL